MEHHSNIVPWQLLAAKRGIAIKVIPMNDKGELLLDEYRQLFSERTRIVSVAHVSNVLGTVNPVKEMIAFAHEQGVPVLVDGAQSIPHMPVDVQDLDADFFVFSAHKVYGPTGVGVLYGKEEWLDRIPPYQGGGEMIQHVSFEKLLSTNCLSSSKPVRRIISVLPDLPKLWTTFRWLGWTRLPPMNAN